MDFNSIGRPWATQEPSISDKLLLLESILGHPGAMIAKVLYVAPEVDFLKICYHFRMFVHNTFPIKCHDLSISRYKLFPLSLWANFVYNLLLTKTALEKF